MTILRDVLWRGVRDVDGIILARGEAARVVAAWNEGADLLNLSDGTILVRYREPVRRRCETAPGLPVIDQNGRLATLPLPAEEVARARSGQVVRMGSGIVNANDVVGAADASSLFDLAGWIVERPTPADANEVGGGLSPVPAIARVDPFDSRSALGNQQRPTDRDRREWDRLRNDARQTRAARGSASKSAQRAEFPWSDRLRRRRQQRYLSELTRLFAQQNTEEALRRAIPFGSGQGADRRALGLPARRDDLRLRPHGARPSSTMPIDPGLRAELQRRYTKAAVDLEAEGRILDAAFVRADLLNSPLEACSLLERHGELRLAAELAEARVTDASLAIRLWWILGDRHRAVVIARRSGCFAPAIERLEQAGEHTDANELRWLWSDVLLRAGDLPGCFDACAPLEGKEAAERRSAAVEQGVAAGGPLRARMLARQLRAADDAPHRVLRDVLDEPFGDRERAVLASELVSSRQPVDHPAAVRDVIRALLVDPTHPPKSTVEQLLGLAADPVLGADLPPLRTPVAATNEPQTWIEVDASDRGQVGVADARYLPDGRVAIALQDGGVRICRPDGRTVFAFDVVAHHLIASDAGNRLLALQQLELGTLAVHVLDLHSRRIKHLGEVSSSVWAQSYDGQAWFLADGQTLWMLDMLADGPTALWRIDDLRQSIVALGRNAGQLSIALPRHWIDRPTGLMAVAVRRLTLPRLLDIPVRDAEWSQAHTLLPSGEVVRGLDADHDHAVSVESGENEPVRVTVNRAKTDVPSIVLRLGGATRARVRLDRQMVVVTDDCGRLEVIDPARRAEVAAIRLRL